MGYAAHRFSDFILKYNQIGHFGHADALSRLIAENSRNQPNEDVVVSSVGTGIDIKQVLADSLRQ